jgi:hypothetical protein
MSFLVFTYKGNPLEEIPKCYTIESTGKLMILISSGVCTGQIDWVNQRAEFYMVPEETIPPVSHIPNRLNVDWSKTQNVVLPVTITDETIAANELFAVCYFSGSE